jgi:CBS domain containing-hemolysin-like protein
MTPRTEMAAVTAETSRDGLVSQFARGRRTRLLVYRGDLDHVVGFLYATDVIRALAAPNTAIDAGMLAREALTVPDTLGADQLLAEMRRRHVREAVVIDEYGGTAGLVTFEALMERIIGHMGGHLGGDAGSESGASPRVANRPDGSADIDGLTLVKDVNEQFELHIDEMIYTTVGGYVLGRLGRRAQAGDIIEVEGRRMRVDQLDGLRVARVWLSTPAG